jgi:putative oxidoreductase
MTMTFQTRLSAAIAAPMAIFSRIPHAFVQLAMRGGLAGIFWSSARTKVEGFLTVSENTFYLFEEDYRLPLLDPEIAAYLATYAEHLLPLLLILGLGTRLAAFGLFVMTLTIQIFVYPDAFVSTHFGWFALALGVMAYGPGKLSIDNMLASKAKQRD